MSSSGISRYLQVFLIEGIKLNIIRAVVGGIGLYFLAVFGCKDHKGHAEKVAVRQRESSFSPLTFSTKSTNC